jgi:hypothetical protein
MYHPHPALSHQVVRVLRRSSPPQAKRRPMQEFQGQCPVRLLEQRVAPYTQGVRHERSREDGSGRHTFQKHWGEREGRSFGDDGAEERPSHETPRRPQALQEAARDTGGDTGGAENVHDTNTATAHNRTLTGTGSCL